MLVKHKISVDEKKVDKDEMLNYVKPKPNRKFLGFYTRLYFYYAVENSEGKFGSWMRDIVGEQPALYDELSIKKNEEQLRLFMNEQGYYNAQVSSHVKFRGRHDKKVTAFYDIVSGDLFTINAVSYQIQDSSIAKILDRTQNSAKVKTGKPFAIGLLQEEQERIVTICNNFGYYAFGKALHQYCNRYTVDYDAVLRKFRAMYTNKYHKSFKGHFEPLALPAQLYHFEDEHLRDIVLELYQEQRIPAKNAAEMLQMTESQIKKINVIDKDESNLPF